MKKTNNIKKYASFALALALATPVTTFASGVEEPNAIVATENLAMTLTPEEVTEKAFTYEVTMSLSEDGHTANYELHIKKLTESTDPIKAYINLADVSNLSNIRLESEEGEVLSTKEDKGETLAFGITESKTYKISADIKEGKIDKLFFDLGLVDSASKYAQSERILSAVVKEDEKDILEKIETAGLSSVLTGKFVDDDTIEWTDYIINDTEDSIKVLHPLLIDQNQIVVDDEISLDTYILDETGFKDYGNTKAELAHKYELELAANSLVRISFKTKVSADADSFNINGVAVNRPTPLSPVEENLGPAAEKDLKTETVVDEEEILVELGAIPTTTTLDTPSTENQAGVWTDEDNKKAAELTEKLESSTEQIQTTLIDNDKALPEVEKGAQVPAPVAKENKTTDTEENAGPKAKKEETPKASTEIKKVPTTVLTDRTDRASKEYFGQNLSDDEQMDKLADKLNGITGEIKDTLIENEKNLPESIMTANKEENLGPAALKSDQKQAPKADETDDEKAVRLTNELKRITEEIRQLLLESVNNDQRVLTKIVSLAPKAQENKDSKDEKVIEEVKAINAELMEVINQVDLALELKQIGENEAELGKITTIVDSLENLNQNSKKALELAKEATDSKKPQDFVKPSFPIAVEGFSEDVYKDLDKVVTVTLDPQKKPKAVSTVDDAAKKYPKVNEYLKRLDERNKLLKLGK